MCGGLINPDGGSYRFFFLQRHRMVACSNRHCPLRYSRSSDVNMYNFCGIFSNTKIECFEIVPWEYLISLLPKRTVRFRIPSYVPHLRSSLPVRYLTPLDQISFWSMFGKKINFCMVINLNLRQLWTLISPVPCALGRQRQFLI